MGKKLLEKASLILGPRPPVAPIAGEVVNKPKTAIGAMAQFTERQSSAMREVESLKGQLRTFDGSLPAKRINPLCIVRSRWANRHALSFAGRDFEALKADIESQGGNVQPIKIRPLPGEQAKYEIVFGHRRHQACLELKLDVLAIVEDINDKTLFIEMDRENRQRKDLRPFEVGAMYAKALDQGLFTSARKLAEEVGIDQSQLNKALALARLPSDVIEAFVSPLDLQYRWASDLVGALQKDPDDVLATAKAIQSEEPRPKSADVYRRLIETRGTVPHLSSRTVSLTGKAGQKGDLVFYEKSRRVEISLSNIDSTRYSEIQMLIKQFIG
ncbi:MAG: ParB/RepB/Spo0J family partition protein [Pseudomonadota bacterium]|nr:ParB/RepB/Spo0J family partition protein [Pseudomonadota bacterium]